MMRAGLLFIAAALAGCVVQDTRPLPKVEATQAVREIPARSANSACVSPSAARHSRTRLIDFGCFVIIVPL